jgi:hypothetical protein
MHRTSSLILIFLPFYSGLEISLSQVLEADDGREQHDMMNGIKRMGLHPLFGVGNRIPPGNIHFVACLIYSLALHYLADRPWNFVYKNTDPGFGEEEYTHRDIPDKQILL